MRRRSFQTSYQWVILAVSFIVVAISYGQRFTFSVFLISLLEEFSWNRAQLSGVFSLNMIVCGVMSPIVGILVDRFNAKQVILVGACLFSLSLWLSSAIHSLWQYYLIYGILGAVGFSLVATVSQSKILVNWFEARGGMAIGVAFSGTGIGILCLLPLSQFLILHLTWRGAYLILGLMIFVFIFILSALFQKERPENRTFDKSGKQSQQELQESFDNLQLVNKNWGLETWTLTKAVFTYQFWLLWVTCVLNGADVYCILVHHMAYLVDMGFDKMLASFMFGLTGIFATIGRGCSGSISDRIGREKTYILFQVLVIISIFVLFALNKESPLFLLLLYGVLLGLGYGGVGPHVIAITVVDIFGRTSFGAIYGFAVLGFGIGNAIGPWLGGFLFDLMGNYRLVFLIAILNLSVSSLLFWIAAPRKIRIVIGKVPEELKKLGPANK